MDREQATTTTDGTVGQALIDAFPDPIVLFRLDERGRWRMTHVNPAAEVLAGYRSTEVEGLGPVQMVGPLTDPNLLSAALDGFDPPVCRPPPVSRSR
jgi:PAS domain-containing protein